MDYKPLKVLYFVKGHAPSKEDVVKARAYAPATVVFRNANAVPNERHALEICDGVAGAVPDLYAKQYPKAEDAIAKQTAEFEKLTAKIGDEKAPVVKTESPKTEPKPKSKPAWTPNAE